MHHLRKMAKDKMNAVRLIFHLGIIFHHALAFYYFSGVIICTRKINHPWIEPLERHQGKFLTLWNFAIQTLYFLLCIFQDTLELQSTNYLQQMNHYIRKLNSYVFQTFVFPLSPVVSLVFWGIYLIDRELVFPKILDECFPAWINHCIHTIDSANVLIEILITINWYKISRWDAICGITACHVAYTVCFFSAYYLDGVWLYPIFITSTWAQRISLVLLVYVGMLLMNAFGEYLITKIWGYEIRKLKAQETFKENKQI